MHIPDIIGLLGVLLVLIAYFFLQTKRLAAESMSFSLYNTIGSVMILYSLIHKWNLSAFAMEGAWLLLSMYGVWKAFKKQ